MTFIANNLTQVRQRIADAARRCGRDPKEITLIAVSKTKPASAIEEAVRADQFSFGENYIQEGLEKITQLQHLALDWHFIGPVQSNKSRLVAQHFAWCHTVDRVKIAQRLNDQRPDCLTALNVLIQVNISDETSKSGIMPEAIPDLAREIARMPRLRLRGLMTIPAVERLYQPQLAVCLSVAEAFTELKKSYPLVDTLSLGMSNDMEAAITVGSTMVRVGSAIFGARHYA